MAASNGVLVRGNLFNHNSASPSPSPQGGTRPKSLLVSSPLSASNTPGHVRNQSLSAIPSALLPSNGKLHRSRTNSKSISNPTSTTFAPRFIQSDDTGSAGVEGENDFSGKRYVWVKDPEKAFVRGWVIEERDESRLLVQCDDGSVSLAITPVKIIELTSFY